MNGWTDIERKRKGGREEEAEHDNQSLSPFD
jgi:hypothetical protein